MLWFLLQLKAQQKVRHPKAAGFSILVSALEKADPDISPAKVSDVIFFDFFSQSVQPLHGEAASGGPNFPLRVTQTMTDMLNQSITHRSASNHLKTFLFESTYEPAAWQAWDVCPLAKSLLLLALVSMLAHIMG